MSRAAELKTQRAVHLLPMKFHAPVSFKTLLLLGCSSALLVVVPRAVAEQTPAAPSVPPAAPRNIPTFADVPYGDHERQVLDFYQAKTDKPAPVLFFIHGGGWVTGDKF